MRALVTGACGFAGGFLVRHLLESGDEVTGTFLKDERDNQNLVDVVFERVALDLTDAGACADLVSKVKPDVVYHLAGIAFVPEAEENFERVLKVNVGATNNIARACHLLDSPTRLLFVSSAEVYGKIGPADLPVQEAQPTRPANNYSLTKLMAELVVARYELGGKISGAVVRPFNHIGPGQDSRFVVSSMAKQLAAIALGQASPTLKIGNLAARRDFSDVRDIVRAYRLAALKGRGVYNLGSGVAVSIQEILDALVRISGLKVSIEQDPQRMRPAEVPELFTSLSRARNELGWNPLISLESSLRDIFEGWKATLSRKD